MSKQIEIKIDSGKLTPEQFIDASKAFVAIVEGVSKNIAGHLLEWMVELDKGSAIVRLKGAAEARDYGTSVDAITRGLSGLNSGVASMPYGFGKPEMKSVKVLVGLRSSEGMRDISVKNGSASEPVSANIIPLIDSILSREKHGEYGSIEGSVVNISLRHGFICTIHDPIERLDILCYLQNQEAQDAVFSAASKRRRVLADGLIHYSDDDVPISITADIIKVFPDESELPSVAEVQTIYNLRPLNKPV